MSLGLPLTIFACISLAFIVLLTQLPLLGNFNTLGIICLAIFAVVAVIVGPILVYRWLTLEKDNELAYQVGEVLKQFFGSDPRYKYVRNVSRRNLGYIDAVLVGPPGVLVFRIVNYTGLWRNERAEWKTLNPKNNKLNPARSNPTRECARDVYALRKYLAKRKLDKVPVFGIVVFYNINNVTLQAAGPVIPVTKTDRLFEVLNRDYLQQERINTSAIDSTVDAIIDG
ncbi:MAG: NERD domain-containing protein [Anaerolineae bacterium]|nr:NERD domain-containing protein [Anaerolineae bacterium]